MMQEDYRSHDYDTRPSGLGFLSSGVCMHVESLGKSVLATDRIGRGIKAMDFRRPQREKLLLSGRCRRDGNWNLQVVSRMSSARDNRYILGLFEGSRDGLRILGWLASPVAWLLVPRTTKR